MYSKCIVIFFLLQVLAVEWLSGHQTSLFRPSESSLKPSLKDLSKRSTARGRRCLGTALSLLWPQVVGPVEQGVITESNFDEIPKTHLEHRLDIIRKKAKQEEEDRLLIRNYFKKLTEAQDEFYGYSYGNLNTNNFT